MRNNFISKPLHASFDTVNDNRHGYGKYIYNVPPDKAHFFDSDYNLLNEIELDVNMKRIFDDFYTLDFNIF